MRATTFFIYLCFLLFGGSSLYAGNGCQLSDSKPLITSQQNASLNSILHQTAFEENKGPFWERSEMAYEDLDDDDDEQSRIAKKIKLQSGSSNLLSIAKQGWPCFTAPKAVVPISAELPSRKHIFLMVIRI